MTLYTLWFIFALLVCILGFWGAWREESNRRNLGAHFDTAVAVGNAEGEL